MSVFPSHQKKSVWQSYYSQYAPKIELMLMGHAAVDDVEDLKQEIFLKVYLGIEHFRGDALPYTWIYQIARHTLYAHYAKKRKEKNHCPFDETLLQDSMLEQKTPEKHWQQHQLIHNSFKSIQSLPETLKTPLILYQLGHSYADIAARTHSDVEHVRSRLYRAREVLKR